MKQELIVLYQQMADHTLPKCKECPVPLSCCDAMYCEMARQIAEDDGITLDRADHPTLPYMGKNGCAVPPHYRPLCTLHTCKMNAFGGEPRDPAWTAKYFNIRDKIDELESDKV